MVGFALAIGGFAVIPRPAAAQGQAFAIVPIQEHVVTLLPGERWTLGDIVKLVPLFPNPIVHTAVASSDGGVRLNGDTSVVRGTLAELLSTVVTASGEGAVTIIIDALVNLNGVPLLVRSIGVMSIKFLASSRYRVTPTASPFHVIAGSNYRLRDLVTFEKIDPNAFINNYGFELTGGVVCTRPGSGTTSVPCRPVPKINDVAAVFTEVMLDSSFAATASGRVTLVLLSRVIERFSIDIVVDPPRLVAADPVRPGPLTPRGLVASTNEPGATGTALGATDSTPTTLTPTTLTLTGPPTTVEPSADAASSSDVPAEQNDVATTASPGSSSSSRPAVTTRPKPKPKSKSKSAKSKATAKH